MACGQILFSLSPGMGTAITMSSYTAPKEGTGRPNPTPTPKPNPNPNPIPNPNPNRGGNLPP